MHRKSDDNIPKPNWRHVTNARKTSVPQPTAKNSHKTTNVTQILLTPASVSPSSATRSQSSRATTHFAMIAGAIRFALDEANKHTPAAARCPLSCLASAHNLRNVDGGFDPGPVLFNCSASPPPPTVPPNSPAPPPPPRRRAAVVPKPCAQWRTNRGRVKRAFEFVHAFILVCTHVRVLWFKRPPRGPADVLVLRKVDREIHGSAVGKDAQV